MMVMTRVHLIQIEPVAAKAATAAEPSRTEFGATRKVCDCKMCATNCRFMPGYLIPADLTRMAPLDQGMDMVLAWAETNLLASPGAVVMVSGQQHRLPTLVPRTKPDGSCIHLDSNNRCGIHAVSPFGCAFFDCKADDFDLSAKGLREIAREWTRPSWYSTIWAHLDKLGLRQVSGEVLRGRMREYMRQEGLL